MRGTNQRLEADFEVAVQVEPVPWVGNKNGHPSATKMDTHQLKNWWEICCIFSPLLPELAIRTSRPGVLYGIAPNSFVMAQQSFAEARDVIFQGKAKF
ncbi:hypothetical protein [Microbulbifer thermotolerans]|uniref:hypothetical protein n=1 Tax=Microbulbifer thermotolerans TaxID=252514 RepID=UPI0012E98ED3|nr:hypothetical protein [Microbulbifer thermotolerans]